MTIGRSGDVATTCDPFGKKMPCTDVRASARRRAKPRTAKITMGAQYR